MHNELLTIGPFTIYGYGLMIAVGIVAAYILAEIRAKKRGMPYEQILSLVLWCVIGGFFSAKLLFWLTQYKEIWVDPAFVVRTLGDGFVVYGGILGGILSGYLFCKRQKLNFLQFFDLIMPSVALAQGFGRLGCLLAGCCYGKEAKCMPSITFQQSDFAPNGVPLIPTQIYSSALDFLHAGILLYVARRTQADGTVAACYLIFYSIGRFCIEYLRGDLERGGIGSFSTSQIISVFLCIAGILFLFFLKRRNKSENQA